MDVIIVCFDFDNKIGIEIIKKRVNAVTIWKYFTLCITQVDLVQVETITLHLLICLTTGFNMIKDGEIINYSMQGS